MQFLILKAPSLPEQAVHLEPVIEALYYKHYAHYHSARIILDTDHPEIFANNPFIRKFTKKFWSFPKGVLSYTHTIEDMKYAEGSQVLLFDFSNPMGSQHLIDQFAAIADVNLLRRTPSVSNFEQSHMIDPRRARIVVELHEPRFENNVIRKEGLPEELTCLPDVVYLKKTSSNYIQTIQGADTYVGPAGEGPILALAAGVRNIIALHSEISPPEKSSYPEIQTFRTDRAGQRESFNRAIVHALNTPKYPDILHRGNAKAFIEARAMFHCRGQGLDVGSNQWPLPGALASDVDSRKFDQGPFDFIFSSHCLEHIKDWEEELKLWDRSLRPGGTAFIYVPHPAMELWRPEGEWVKGGWHVWSPSPVSLTMWLHENTNIQVQSYNSYPDFAWSFCLIGKKY